MKNDPKKNSALLAVFALASTVGCGGDDKKGSREPVGPSGDVELRIVSFYNDQGAEFSRDEAGSLVLGCDGSIGVDVGPSVDGRLENWLLRSPGTCGSFKQCGYVELVVDPGSDDPDRVASSASSFEVPGVVQGRHTFEVTLRTDDGEVFLQAEEPVTDRVDVSLMASNDCGATTGSGGSGAAGGAGGTGGGSGGVGATSPGGAAGEGGAAGAN
jgi:hypothetical protein